MTKSATEGRGVVPHRHLNLVGECDLCCQMPERKVIHQIVTGAQYSPDKSELLAKVSGNVLME